MRPRDRFFICLCVLKIGRRAKDIRLKLFLRAFRVWIIEILPTRYYYSSRNKHRGIFCMSFILSVLFYLYISAIVAAHNRHRRVLPYIGSETKHIVKEGEGFFSRLVFRRSSSKHHHGLDEVVHVPSSSSSHRSHHEDMELELEDEDSNVARMFYHH